MDCVRSGQWTSEEVTFATRLIDEFRNGSLQIPDGTSMRGFLAEKLGCVPKRISKKYENTYYNGRLQYARDKTLSAEECVRTRLDLEKLERAFKASVLEVATPKEATKKPEKERHHQVPNKINSNTFVVNEAQKLEEAKHLHAQAQAQMQAELERKQKLQLQLLLTDSTRIRHPSVAHRATASSGLLSGADLKMTLKRNNAAATAANDELRSILAARQRLAQQNLALHSASLRLESPPFSAAAAARKDHLLSALSSLQQQPPSNQPPQPPMMHAESASSCFDRLCFLRQIEMEQQQRLLAAAAAPSATSANSAPPQWNRLAFQQQAKLLARNRDNDLLQRKGTAPGEKQVADFMSAISDELLLRGRNHPPTSAFKRKEAPTASALFPDPKRPRHFY